MAKKSKVGDEVRVDIGRLMAADPNFGCSVKCFVCEAEHKASGLVRIVRNGGATCAPLCEACMASPDPSNLVMQRKVWPGVEVKHVDGATGLAMREKLQQKPQQH